MPQTDGHRSLLYANRYAPTVTSQNTDYSSWNTLCIEKGRIFSNMLYVRYIHLRKAKPILKRQNHLLVREFVT
jgi:hypothetical protein